MPMFEIYCSPIGSGVVEITAKNWAQAEKLLFDNSIDDLIEICDFGDGIEIVN
jgi:hypothetical protein